MTTPRQHLVRRCLVAALVSIGTLATTSSSMAQAPWPAKSIRIVVGFAPGGTTDVMARVVAQGLGEAPQWLYAVAFDGAELWGADADPGQRVVLDIWQSNLAPA